MECLENCDILKNCSPEFKDRIKLACVLLKNEAYIVDIEDQVFYIVNDRKFTLYILCGKKVKQFVYSFYTNDGLYGQFSYHMMALTEDGRIYGWGGNRYDQIITNTSLEIPESARIKYANRILDRNRIHRVEGHLSELFYELSETPLFICCSPTLINCGKWSERYIKYDMIDCGSAHSIALTNNNEVVVWGSNKFGQLGIGSNPQNDSAIKFKVCSKPSREHVPVQPCKMLCCACTTGIVLSATLPFVLCSHIGCLELTSFFMDVMSCFCGYYCCEICIPKENKNLIIREKGTITAVGCGATHNLVLFENGNLWGWGNNHSGQLGRKSNLTILYPCPIFDQVKKFVAFNDNTFVLKNDGTLYSMGDNSFGQLGHFDQFDSKEPILIKEHKFKDITAIGQLCLGQTIEDKFYAWGLYKSEIIREIVEIKHKGDPKIGAENQTSENNNVESNETEPQPILPEVNQQSIEQPQDTYIASKRVKAHIFVKPTLVTCNSFDDFISHHCKLTNFTVQLDQSGCSQTTRNSSAKTINLKDLIVIEYNVRLDKSGKQMSVNNINVDQTHTYRAFENSSLSSGLDINFSNNDFCDKKTENSFNSKIADFFRF